MKAMNLADAIATFNPREPLHGRELAEFYVDRPGNPLEAMKIFLLGLRDQPVKLLFSGHRGCGKSTELNKLAEGLKRQFFIVPVDVSRFANVMTYQDILFGMAVSLYKRAEEKDVVARSPVAIVKDAWNQAVEFMQRRLYGSVFPDAPISTEEVTVKFNIWVTELEAKYNLAPDARQRTAAYLDEHLDELHQNIELVSGLVRQHVKRPVLFIVEGADKADIDRARQIFYEHTNALTAFQTAVIYTFPISLAYSGEFVQIGISYNRHFTLPNLNITTREGMPDEQGLEKLRRIVQLRLTSEMISPSALEMLIHASGGVIVFLIRNIQTAAVHALSRGSQVIADEDAQDAINKERSDFVRVLRSEDYPVLVARRADKQLSGDIAVQRLLQCLALLEYANGEPWCDVHPVIIPLLEERT
jgi:hypothetical protein